MAGRSESLWEAHPCLRATRWTDFLQQRSILYSYTLRLRSQVESSEQFTSGVPGKLKPFPFSMWVQNDKKILYHCKQFEPNNPVKKRWFMILICDIEKKRTPSQIWRQKTTWTILVGHQSSSNLRSPAESFCSSNRPLTDLRLGQQISVP